LYVDFINPSVGWSGWFNASSTSGGMWKWNDLTSPLNPDFSASQLTSCVNAQVVLTDLTSGAVPTSWSWSFPGGTPATSTQQNPIVTYPQPGVYDVVLTVGNGTSQTTLSQPAYITVVLPTSQPSVISGPTSVCDSSTAMYSVILVPDVIYGWTLPLGWSGMSSSNAINVQANTTSGNVMVSAENACGVSTPSILFVNVTPGGPTASFSYTSQNGVVGFNSGASQNASNWTWDFGDGATSIEANPTHTFGSNGTFEVQLIVSNGCGTDTLIQTVNISGLQVNAIFDQLVQLYPNPFDNELNVELPPVFVGGQIRMLDMNGKELKNVAVKQEKMVLNIDYLDAGCYFVELSDAFMAKKLIVKVFKQ